MNYINYINHTIFNPDTYQRRYDYDLSNATQEIQRVALALLPIAGLYRPLAPYLSLGMGGCRIFTHLHAASKLEKTEYKKLGIELGHTALASLSLITRLFSFSAGLFITTGFDLAQALATTTKYIHEGAYDKAGEEA